jgi:hypothetical protein
MCVPFQSVHHVPHHRIAIKSPHHRIAAKSLSALPQSQTLGEAAVAELDDDRRANVFQALLRDLQIENFQCSFVGMRCTRCPHPERRYMDNDVGSFPAILWTTMSEVSESDESQNVCE